MFLPISSAHTYLILGLGKSGRSAANFLRKHQAKVLTFDDNPESTPDFTPQTLKSIPWAEINFVVQSAGIPLWFSNPHPVTALAKEWGIPLITDIDLFRQAHPQARVVGITGTNGKSTTTALIGHILQKHHYPCAVGGNIGIPVLDLPELEENGVYVLELSSYQLELSQALNLEIAVWTNLTEDHIDRHKTLEGYASAKERIFLGAKQSVISIDDPFSKAASQRMKAKLDHKSQSVSCVQDADVWVKGGVLCTSQEIIANLNQLKNLKGRHNHQNIAIAFSVCKLLGIPQKVILEGIETFPGLAHRQEIVATYNDILFINDSKATNAQATMHALESYKKHPIYWIAGGIAKSQGIEPLKDYFPLIKHTFLIGQAQEQFAQTLKGYTLFTFSEDLENALKRSIETIQAERDPHLGTPVVLFSPACASFDQFRNFEQRGEVFCKLVQTFTKLEL